MSNLSNASGISNNKSSDTENDTPISLADLFPAPENDKLPKDFRGWSDSQKRNLFHKNASLIPYGSLINVIVSLEKLSKVTKRERKVLVSLVKTFKDKGKKSVNIAYTSWKCQDRIGTENGYRRDSVNKAIKSLCDKGMLHKKSSRLKSSRTNCAYAFTGKFIELIQELFRLGLGKSELQECHQKTLKRNYGKLLVQNSAQDCPELGTRNVQNSAQDNTQENQQVKDDAVQNPAPEYKNGNGRVSNIRDELKSDPPPTDDSMLNELLGFNSEGEKESDTFKVRPKIRKRKRKRKKPDDNLRAHLANRLIDHCKAYKIGTPYDQINWLMAFLVERTNHDSRLEEALESYLERHRRKNRFNPYFFVKEILPEADFQEELRNYFDQMRRKKGNSRAIGFRKFNNRTYVKQAI